MRPHPSEAAPKTGILGFLPGGTKDTGIKIEPPTRIDLETAIAAQVDMLLDRNYHKILGLTKDEYRAAFALPEGATQPPEYPERFNELFVVDPRVGLISQLNADNIHRDSINTDGVTSYAIEYSIAAPRRVEFAPRPYVLWGTTNIQLHTEPVGRFKQRPPTEDERRARLAVDERPGYVMELLALLRLHPELLAQKLLVVAENSSLPSLNNTNMSSERGAPYVDFDPGYRDRHKILLSYPYDRRNSSNLDERVHGFGTMIVGRQVIRLGPRPERVWRIGEDRHSSHPQETFITDPQT